MNLKLSAVDSLEGARALLPLVERGLRETGLGPAGEMDEEGAAESFLERQIGRPETLLVVAESEGEPHALCVTAPFEDPLTGRVAPMLVLLWVDPALRHQGVAGALVRETQRLLAARGQPVLLARADHNDDALISMGERWGLVRSWEVMSSE